MVGSSSGVVARISWPFTNAPIRIRWLTRSVTLCVLDRHRSALGDADEGEAFQLQDVDDRLEVLHEQLEVDLVRVVVGEPATPLVVPDEGAMTDSPSNQCRHTGLRQS